MSEKYCPLLDGECERKTIRKYCKPFDDQPDEFIANYKSCPWPSRQVPVKGESEGRYCPDTKRNCQYLTPTGEELAHMINQAVAAGRRAGIEECIALIENATEEWQPAIYSEKVWWHKDEIVEAFGKLLDPAPSGGREE